MYDSGSGKVHITVAQIHCGSKLRHPAAAPRPATGNRVENRADEEFTQQKRPEADAFADCADDDVSGRLHEHDFKQGQAIAPGVICRTDEEEALSAHEPPLPAADQKMVQGRNAAEICRRSVNRDCSKLECVSDRVVREEGEDIRREVQHHEMGGVFLSYQTTSQQGKPCLHEQHEVARVQRPRHIGRDADVADAVGELHRQRFLSGLSLVVVEGLLVLRVIGSRLIGGFDRNKWISGSIDRSRFVPGGGAGGIRFGAVVGKAESGQPKQQSCDENNCGAGGHQRPAQNAPPCSLRHLCLLLFMDLHNFQWQRPRTCGADTPRRRADDPTQRVSQNQSADDKCAYSLSPIQISYSNHQEKSRPTWPANRRNCTGWLGLRT